MTLESGWTGRSRWSSKLKELLTDIKVASKFDKCQEVGKMVSKMLEKANECTNPTAPLIKLMR